MGLDVNIQCVLSSLCMTGAAISNYLAGYGLNSAGNEVYLYEMLATNFLQAMLIGGVEQSLRQSSNSAVPTL